MKTKILTVSEAVDFLKKGEPVAIPTETVYGLAAPIYSDEAVQKIFSLKGRPQDNPLIAHVSNFEMLEKMTHSIPESFWLLAQKFWPGPITFVLPKTEAVSLMVSGGLNTIGVRMPSHPLALKLIEALEEPLVAPSANLSGKPSPTQLKHVLEDFDGTIVGVLDGGSCKVGIESTIISLVGTPTLLRPGAISKKMIEEVLGLSLKTPSDPNRPLAPGMKYRHYAPKGALRIVYRPEEITGAFVLSNQPIENKTHRPLSETTFYQYLREADSLGVDEIFVLLDPHFHYSEGLLNRILKAASST